MRCLWHVHRRLPVRGLRKHLRGAVVAHSHCLEPGRKIKKQYFVCVSGSHRFRLQRCPPLASRVVSTARGMGPGIRGFRSLGPGGWGVRGRGPGGQGSGARGAFPTASLGNGSHCFSCQRFPPLAVPPAYLSLAVSIAGVIQRFPSLLQRSPPLLQRFPPLLQRFPPLYKLTNH